MSWLEAYPDYMTLDVTPATFIPDISDGQNTVSGAYLNTSWLIADLMWFETGADAINWRQIALNRFLSTFPVGPC